MKVSPEWYYEKNLKEKTADEIKSRMHSLKHKIRQLQKEVDNPESKSW